MPINTSIPGQLRDEEMQAIELVAALVPPEGHIVEVGSLLGLSSWIWAKSAHASVTVHCIDPWELGAGGNFTKLAADHRQSFTKAQFLTNVRDCANVRAHQGHSPDDFLDWRQPIDLYYEDAVHTDPILAKNLEFWCSHLKPGGIICGHDYTERFPDVRAGVARLAARYRRRLQLVGTFWMLLPLSLADADDARIQTILARLAALGTPARPAAAGFPEQRETALAKANAIPSFAYEIAIDGAPGEIAARQGEDIVLHGTVRNTSGYDWPAKLSSECYLEMGAELQVGNKKVAVSRQAIAGDVMAAGQTRQFALRLNAAEIGAGLCTIDLLFRHLFWFGSRGAEAIRIPVHVAPATASAKADDAEANAGLTTASQIRWFHSYDFGDGEITSGRKPLDTLRREADVFFSEPVVGKTVLDIGAWDGYFSFEAERRGASDVLATDHFCWSGPGWGNKSGFDYAHRKFRSRVRSLDADVFALDPQNVGVFDVVLFPGVLYHLKNPFGGLEQVSRLTRSLAVIETAVDELDHPRAVMRYYLGDELNGDPTNFFVPNYKCLEYMLRDVGFTRFKFSSVSYPVPPPLGRVVVHAWK